MKNAFNLQKVCFLEKASLLEKIGLLERCFFGSCLNRLSRNFLKRLSRNCFKILLGNYFKALLGIFLKARNFLKRLSRNCLNKLSRNHLNKLSRNHLKGLSRNHLKALPRNCLKIFFGMLALFCLSEAKDLIQDKSKASNTSNTRKESKESKFYLAISSQKENSKTILNSSKPDSKNLIQENAKASNTIRESKEAKGFKDIKESKASKDFNASNARKESKANIPSRVSKNGFFIGLEGDIGDIGVKSEFFLLDTGTDEIRKLNVGKSSHTTFDYGLIGGYQHYFGKSKRNGIKVASHFYYATFGNTLNTSLSPTPWNQTIPYPRIFFNLMESFISFKLGLDVSYLYDFFERGKHTLGLSVGAGYQMNAYIKGKLKVRADLIDKTGEMVDSAQGEISTKNMILNRFYPFIGLHYYYGAHQLEVMYKFGGIPYINQMIPRNLDRFPTPVLQNTFSANSYLSFSYSYRF